MDHHANLRPSTLNALLHLAANQSAYQSVSEILIAQNINPARRQCQPLQSAHLLTT